MVTYTFYEIGVNVRIYSCVYEFVSCSFAIVCVGAALQLFALPETNLGGHDGAKKAIRLLSGLR